MIRYRLWCFLVLSMLILGFGLTTAWLLVLVTYGILWGAR